MGIAIWSPKNRGPYPRPVTVKLECDGCKGFFRSSDELTGGFIAIYAKFMAKGWKDCHKRGQRVFLGPCCSGKKVRS
jgi:hypothetical protein